MSPSQRQASQDSSADGIRKRVGKACDRCRLKKSKCDGALPCSRCKLDNAICVFGERKKVHDKVYPKGYVEMLEQQQNQLVSGLQEMYRRLQTSHVWEGPNLSESTGHPLTHDILAALDLLESKHDESGEYETFEEDLKNLQSKLIAQGAGFTHRRGSISSDSEHSHHDHSQSTSRGSPASSKSMHKDDFAYTNSPSPMSPHSALSQHMPSTAMPSPLQNSLPLTPEPSFYTNEWTMDATNDDLLFRSRLAMPTTDFDQSFDAFEADLSMDPSWGEGCNPLNLTMSGLDMAYPTPIPLGQQNIDPMEAEFSQFIQVVT